MAPRRRCNNVLVSGEPLSSQWVINWRLEVSDFVGAALHNFEERFGFAPGANLIRVPSADDRSAAGAISRDSLCPPDLVTFYESIGEVSLPDVSVGYFIHSPRLVLSQYSQGGPVFLPKSNDPHGLVIGSDGGGHLYAADWAGSVHLSRAASFEAEFDQVAATIGEYLDQLRTKIRQFALNDD